MTLKVATALTDALHQRPGWREQIAELLPADSQCIVCGARFVRFGRRRITCGSTVCKRNYQRRWRQMVRRKR